MCSVLWLSSVEGCETGSESGAMATQGDVNVAGNCGSEGSEDTKPDPLQLITAMLAQQSKKANRLAREQAERAEAQTRRLEEILNLSLASVR